MGWVVAMGGDTGWLGVTIAAGVLVGLVVLDPVRAEGTTLFVPFFAASNVYDDNVFSSPFRPTTDLFVRYTPGIQWTYQNATLMVDGRYAFDAEFYSNETQLNDYRARQVASVGVQRSKDRFTTLQAGATYAETQRPGDLVQSTGLDLERAHAEAYTARLGFERRSDASETWGAGYDYTLLMIEGEESVGSHRVTWSLSRRLTPFTRVTVRAGPQFIEADLAPDLSASIDHRLERGALAISFQHSRNPVPGPDAAVWTDAVTLSATRQFRPSFRVGVSPSLLENRRGEATARVYRISVSFDVQINRWLALQVSDGYSVQDGTTVASAPDPRIRHNIVTVSVKMATQFRPQPSEWRTHLGGDR